MKIPLISPEDERYPPIVHRLFQVEYIEVIGDMIVGEQSLRAIQRKFKEMGDPVSINSVRVFREAYRKEVVKKAKVTEYLQESTIAELVNKRKKYHEDDHADQMKNDLDYIDRFLDIAYQNLTLQFEQVGPDMDIAFSDVFKAIELKDKLTDGHLGGMTKTGIDELQEITELKYITIIKYLISIVPKEKQADVLYTIDVLEEEFYKATPYYKEFLMTRGISDKEIERKLLQAKEEKLLKAKNDEKKKS